MIISPFLYYLSGGLTGVQFKNHNCADSYHQAVAKHCYFNNGRGTENSFLLVVTINKKTVQW